MESFMDSMCSMPNAKHRCILNREQDTSLCSTSFRMHTVLDSCEGNWMNDGENKTGCLGVHFSSNDLTDRVVGDVSKIKIDIAPEDCLYCQVAGMQTDSVVDVGVATEEENDDLRIYYIDFSPKSCTDVAPLGDLTIEANADPSKNARYVNHDPSQCDPHMYPQSLFGVSPRRSAVCDTTALRRKYERQDLGCNLQTPPSADLKRHVRALKNSRGGSEPARFSPSDFEATALPNISFASPESRSYRQRASTPSIYEVSLEAGGWEAESVNSVCGAGEPAERMRLKWDCLESPESCVRRGEIFELCNGSDIQDDDGISSESCIRRGDIFELCSEHDIQDDDDISSESCIRRGEVFELCNEHGIHDDDSISPESCVSRGEIFELCGRADADDCVSSPESCVRRGEIFELCDEDDVDEDSVANSTNSSDAHAGSNSSFENDITWEDDSSDDSSCSLEENDLSFNLISESPVSPVAGDMPPQTDSFSSGTENADLNRVDYDLLNSCTTISKFDMLNAYTFPKIVLPRIGKTACLVDIWNADTVFPKSDFSRADTACDYRRSFENTASAMHDSCSNALNWKKTITNVKAKTDGRNNEPSLEMNIRTEIANTEVSVFDRKELELRKGDTNENAAKRGRFCGVRKLVSNWQNGKKKGSNKNLAKTKHSQKESQKKCSKLEKGKEKVHKYKFILSIAKKKQNKMHEKGSSNLRSRKSKAKTGTLVQGRGEGDMTSDLLW